MNQAQLDDLTRFLNSVQGDPDEDPYAGGDDEVPTYPPHHAVQVTTTTDAPNTVEAAFNDGQNLVRCSWTTDTLTVYWRTTSPQPDTCAELGLGNVEDPKSGRWLPLGPSLSVEQERTFALQDLSCRMDQPWWIRLHVSEDREAKHRRLFPE